MSESEIEKPTAGQEDQDEIDPVEKYPYHRQYVRHEIRLKVDVQTESSFHAWTHNISRDGLCVEIPARLQIGREITTWLFLDSEADDNPVQARCRVVWREDGSKTTRHGCQFLFFATDGKERLNGWLEDYE